MHACLLKPDVTQHDMLLRKYICNNATVQPTPQTKSSSELWHKSRPCAQPRDVRKTA